MQVWAIRCRFLRTSVKHLFPIAAYPRVLRGGDADAAQGAGILPQKPFPGRGLLPQLDGAGGIRTCRPEKQPEIARLHVLGPGIR